MFVNSTQIADTWNLPNGVSYEPMPLIEFERVYYQTCMGEAGPKWEEVQPTRYLGGTNHNIIWDALDNASCSEVQLGLYGSPVPFTPNSQRTVSQASGYVATNAVTFSAKDLFEADSGIGASLSLSTRTKQDVATEITYKFGSRNYYMYDRNTDGKVWYLTGCGASTDPAPTFGPLPYRQRIDNPFHELNNPGSFEYYHTENFEAGQITVPGVTAIVGTGFTKADAPAYVDSVDEDDSLDNRGSNGNSYYNKSGTAGVTFEFDELALRGLPTHVGLVWTDGKGDVFFRAYDRDDREIGMMGPYKSGDSSWSGTTAEDRFYGFYSPAGIKRVTMSMTNSVNAMEVDHLQFGRGNNIPTSVQAVPYGLTPYTKYEDSPFSSIHFKYFRLENFEDGIYEPGLFVNGGASVGQTRSFNAAAVDSVDLDDGNPDGSGSNGNSYCNENGTEGLTFTFVPSLPDVPELPTYAGIVWTDGAGEATVRAYNSDGALVGQIGPVAVGDTSWYGTTAEDRFFGFYYTGGIKRLEITTSSNTLEVDHVQFGSAMQ